MVNTRNETETQEDYDVIIIGAGVGGLICGNFLALDGKRVLICEQNSNPGGYVSGFKRKGFYFDAAALAFENSSIIFSLLKKLGIYNMVKFVRLDYRLVTPDIDVNIDSIGNVAQAFQRAFPEDSLGTGAFFREITNIIKAAKKALITTRNPQIETGWRFNLPGSY